MSYRAPKYRPAGRRFSFETCEDRRLLSVSVQVNFQPASTVAPAGYLVDSGQAYGDRGNGFAYGWGADNTANVRQRPTAAGDDVRYRTLAMMQQGANVSWEIGLPNGTYRVHVVSGDPTFPTATARVNAEGLSVVNGVTSATNPFVDGWRVVTVTDGRLTISPGAGAYQAKINFVEITDALTSPMAPVDFPAVTRPVSIGTNIDAISYFSTIGPFNDLAAEFNRWASVAKPSDITTRTAELTADNYPLSDAATITFATGYPSGDYAVSYRGTGTVTFADYSRDANGVRVIVELPFTPVPGDDGAKHGTLHLDVPAVIESHYFVLRITGIDANDPVHDLHIISPDANPDPTNPFRPVFLEKLAAFDGPLRMMGWGQTNFSPVVSWSQRATTAHLSFYNEEGVPYEYQIQLANLLHKDLWINVPHQADVPFIDALATMLKAQLDPSLKLYVEYSNETWNGGFSSNGWGPTNLGQASYLDFRANLDHLSNAQEMGKQTLRVAERFQTIFGAARYAGQVRTILGAFIVDASRAQQALDYIKAVRPGHAVNEYVSGIAIAPYVGNESDMAAIDNADLTLDKLFAWMNNWVDTTLDGWIKGNAVVADRFEVSLEAYEGGQHLQALSVPGSLALKTAAQDDPRMADFYRHLITRWVAAGGNTFGNFTLATKNSTYGFWGMLQNIKQAVGTSVKYQAVAGLAGQTMAFISVPSEEVAGMPAPAPKPAPKPVVKPAPAVKPTATKGIKVVPPRPVTLPGPPVVKRSPFAGERVARVFD